MSGCNTDYVIVIMVVNDLYCGEADLPFATTVTTERKGRRKYIVTKYLKVGETFLPINDF